MRRTHIAVGALALAVSACSGGSAATTTTSTTTVPPTTTTTSPPSTFVIGPESATDVLEVWAPASLIGPIGDASAAFEIETGIDVQVVATDTEAIRAMLLEDPASGPDIFVGPHVWLTTLTTAGVAEPLVVPESVVAAAREGITLRETTYAIPIGLDAIVQFRNASALSSSPETVESFSSGCSVGGSTVPCLLLSPTSVEGHWPFLAGLGGYLFGPDEFAGWDKDDVGVANEQALASGAILESIVGGAGIRGDGETAARDRFIAGDAPLFWGDLDDMAALEAAGMDVAVDPLPTIGGEASPVPIKVTALWVNAFSGDKEPATELVERHLSQVENARTLAMALGLAPVDQDFASDPDLARFTEAAIHGQPVPPIAATTLAWEKLAAAFTAIREGQGAESALRAAASTIRADV